MALILPHALPTLDRQLQDRLPAVIAWQPTALRRAAVLCPIVEREGLDHLLFVMRPEAMHNHAGQIAFPGGMRDDGESPIETALRECHEEVGAAADALTVLGSLPPRTSSSGILVHCVVARLAPVPLMADPREVVRMLHMPLAELRDDRRWQDKPPPYRSSGKQPATSPHFEFGSDLLWGLTARFVRDLLRYL